MVCQVHLNNNSLANAAVQRLLECWMLWRLQVSSNFGINIIETYSITILLVFSLFWDEAVWKAHFWKEVLCAD